MMDWLSHGDYAASPLNISLLILGLLLAFVCGQVLAWVYMATHAGLSYSRSFTNSLVMLPILVSLVMQVLNNNLVTAFGLMAVFASFASVTSCATLWTPLMCFPSSSPAWRVARGNFPRL